MDSEGITYKTSANLAAFGGSDLDVELPFRKLSYCDDVAFPLLDSAENIIPKTIRATEITLRNFW